MILNNYTQTRANRLTKLTVPEITEPFGVRVLWIRALSVESNARAISRHRHKHSYFEAHFMFSGAMKYSVDGEGTYSLEAGNGLLISPEVSHTVSDLDSDLIKITIAFMPTDEHETFKKMITKRSHPFKIDTEMLNAFDKMLTEADIKGTLSPYIIREKVFSVLCSIIRKTDAETKVDTRPSISGTDVRIESAMQYIEDNKNIFLTCEDVAQYCHFNVKYLNRIFKRQTGMTLLEYIHTVKIKEAERLLTQTELSLDAISTCLGFSNEYYFNCFFRRVSGIAPGTYRKLAKK